MSVGTYIIRRTYTATIASKGIYLNTDDGTVIGPITEWQTATHYKVNDYVISLEGLFRCKVEHDSEVFRHDINYWVSEYTVATSVIDDSQISDILTWSSGKIQTFVNTYSVRHGTGKFSGVDSNYNPIMTTISHGGVSKPSFIQIMPNGGNTKGELGEYFIQEINAQQFSVGNTGESYANNPALTFSWVALA